ncbi:MAG TPA: HAD family phosphatase [Bacteroidales bacterium]|nr:HAD family phosphatase [Bacteroidales bacterium]
MLKLRQSIPGHQGIRNIIFDFGGVICDIDISKTEKKFTEFGEAVQSSAEQDSPAFFSTLVKGLELGKVDPATFKQIIQQHYVLPPTIKAIEDAWNALLGEIPGHRIRLLEQLRNSYRIFLLSNTNVIHYEKYLRDFRVKFGYENFEALFEKVYFSHLIGLSKPGKEIFEHVATESHLLPAETLFIDDMAENVAGAVSAGFTGYHLTEGTDITDLFVLV